MGDIPGRLELIPETFDRLLVCGDFMLYELKGDFRIDFVIEDLVDLSHPPFAELLDDLVAAGKYRARGEFLLGWFESFCKRGLDNAA